VSDQTQDHRSLSLRRDLTAIAAAWPDLLGRLTPGSAVDNSGVRKKPNPFPPLPIDSNVSDVIGEVTEWVLFLAHVLMDETDWTPPEDTSTPSLCLALRDRVGHFSEHPDELLALGILADADRLSRLALHTARPSGRRTIRLGIDCAEHTTSDMGERVPCPGQYATTISEDERLADLVCTQDKTHRVTPAEWFRAQRRGAYDQRAVDDLVRSVLRVGGSA